MEFIARFITNNNVNLKLGTIFYSLLVQFHYSESLVKKEVFGIAIHSL